MTLKKELMREINRIWLSKDAISEDDIWNIEYIIQKIDSGEIRAAEKVNGQWIVNQAVKKAILLYFRTQQIEVCESDPFIYMDKIGGKREFSDGVRLVPGSFARCGSYIGEKAVIMGWVNIGAYIGAGTMIDSFALAGSCCQIGKNCHISAHVNIGGVLEPPQASPVIIEDNCFIGAGARILEGAIVKENSAVKGDVILCGNTKVIDLTTGRKIECQRGIIPSGKVAKMGMERQTIESGEEIFMPVVYLTKDVDECTSAKIALEECLR